MDRIRAFLAVSFGDFYRAETEGLIRELKKFIPKAGWTNPSNLHLTLHFFGDVSSDDVGRIAEAMSSIRLSAIRLVPKGIGAFPDESRPKIVWIGLEGETKRLFELKSEVDRILPEVGHVPEKRDFRPHMTIARLKEPARPLRIPDALRRLSFSGACDVRHVTLYKSDLLPSGPVYSVLHQIPFAHG